MLSSTDATITRNSNFNENLHAEGIYDVKCYDKDGNLKWSDKILNTVMTLGKNELLNQALAGSAYTTNGPYMAIISGSGYTSVPVAADTITSHATWFESGSSGQFTPYYATRANMSGSWAAAASGSKVLSASMSFTITGSGTAKGAMVVLGSGATNGVQNTSGILLSAGLFSGGDKTVSISDTLSCSWSLSI